MLSMPNKVFGESSTKNKSKIIILLEFQAFKTEAPGNRHGALINCRQGLFMIPSKALPGPDMSNMQTYSTWHLGPWAQEGKMDFIQHLFPRNGCEKEGSYASQV